MRIVVLGPPGAGKGTQSARLASSLGVAHVATGDMLRGEVAAGSELGRRASSYMELGELVPDELVIRMIAGRLARGGEGAGMVLDGFPRTVAQAKALDEALASDGSAIDRAVNLEVSREELVRRLAGRLVCGECEAPYHLSASPPQRAGICDRCGGELVQRVDDRAEAVARRFEVYRERTAPVLEYYEGQGRLVCIDGEQHPDRVFELLAVAVG